MNTEHVSLGGESSPGKCAGKGVIISAFKYLGLLEGKGSRLGVYAKSYLWSVEKFQENRFTLNIWRLCLQISCSKIENLTYKVTHIPTSHKSLGRGILPVFLLFSPAPASTTPGSGPTSNSLVSLTRPALDLYAWSIYFCCDSSRITTIISQLE